MLVVQNHINPPHPRQFTYKRLFGGGVCGGGVGGCSEAQI